MAITSLIRLFDRPRAPQEVPLIDDAPLAAFVAAARATPPATVLEAGTAQAVPGVSTHHMRLFDGIERSQYTMIDIQAGADVDVVADLHDLPTEWTGRFGAFVASAVFEHLDRPWIAANEVARVLAPSGICYIATHQTFPLHGFPQDFWRFSTEALSMIFTDAGLEIVSVAYKHRTKIVLPSELMPREHTDGWNALFPSWAIVHLAARKPG